MRISRKINILCLKSREFLLVVQSYFRRITIFFGRKFWLTLFYTTYQRSIAFIVFLSKWKWIWSNSPLRKYFGELTSKWNLKYVTNSICLYLLSILTIKVNTCFFVLNKIRVFFMHALVKKKIREIFCINLWNFAN